MTLPIRLAAAALAAGPALAQAPEAETFTTPGGHEVVHVALPEAEYGDVTLFWPGPPALGAPGHEGLYSLGPQHAFARAGGRSLDEIGEAMEDAASNVGIVNTFSGTMLYLQATDGEFGPAAEVARDVLHDAALEEDDLDDLKRDFEDALAESERDPAAMAERALGALVAGGDRRLAALSNRPFETVERVEASEVRGWMEATFDASPLVFSAGPVGEEAVGEVVDAVLEGLPAASGEPGGPEPIAFRGAGTTAAVRAPEADVAVVMLAFPAPMQSAELDAALSALIGGDGSRLFERVREEEGASYGLEWGSIALLPDLQLVTIGGAAPPERAGEVVAMVREELSRLRAEGVTGPELDAAREERLAAEREVLADPGTVTSILLDQVLLGRGPDPALFARGAALGVEGVNAALPELLPEAVAAVVVTPDPEAAGADCIVDVPEEAAGCAP